MVPVGRSSGRRDRNHQGTVEWRRGTLHGPIRRVRAWAGPWQCQNQAAASLSFLSVKSENTFLAFVHCGGSNDRWQWSVGCTRRRQRPPRPHPWHPAVQRCARCSVSGRETRLPNGRRNDRLIDPAVENAESVRSRLCRRRGSGGTGHCVRRARSVPRSPWSTASPRRPVLPYRSTSFSSRSCTRSIDARSHSFPGSTSGPKPRSPGACGLPRIAGRHG